MGDFEKAIFSMD